MAKKHHTSSVPNVPTPINHFRQTSDETTSDGLEAILAESRKISKHAFNMRQPTSSDILESNYGKRRRDAIRRSFPSVINHRGFTEKTRGFITAAEVWSCLNLYPQSTPEILDEDFYLLLAASIWLLDHIEDIRELKSILSAVKWTENWDMPYVYDLRYSEDMIQATLFILENRTDSDRYILDVNPGRGPTADAFDKLLALVPADALRRAVGHTRSLFWTCIDQFYDIECAFAKPYIKAVEKYDSYVDSYNENVKRLVTLVEERKNELAAPKKPNNVLAIPLLQIPKTPVPSRIEPLGNDIFPLDSPFLPPLPDSFNEIIQLTDMLERMGDGLTERYGAISRVHADMVATCFDFARYGLVEAEQYRTEEMPAIVPPPVSNPFDICAGLLLLCSEASFRALYADVPGAMPDKDLDLPWLLGAMEGMLTDVARHLPWGMGHYVEDDIPFKDSTKPMAHPDWFALTLQDRQSLAQTVYQATGALLPRDMNAFDGLKSHLSELGIRGKSAVNLAELMSVLEAVQLREELPADADADGPAPEDTEDVDALKAQVTALQERLKKATDTAHAQDRRARKAEADLAAERDKAEADRRELAGLREVVFTADHRDDDHINIVLPYEVRQRTVIFGGHDMWQKPMKDFLIGEVRFIDRDMVAFDADVIRHAEVIWIQTNAISHKMYYKIMDAVRKWKIPVKYFLYASARKCAEQIALDERA